MIAEWWNQVSATAMHGLQITVVGMLLVFFTLGLIIIAMILLTKLPWLQVKQEPKDKAAAAIEPAPAPAIPATPSVQVVDDELARVAAIAVALLPSRQSSGARGAARPQVRRTGGKWRAYGRAYQLGLLDH